MLTEKQKRMSMAFISAYRSMTGDVRVEIKPANGQNLSVQEAKRLYEDLPWFIDYAQRMEAGQELPDLFTVPIER